ncbi:MAG: adenylosuccinate lyase [Bdellovibrionales bacterium]|nr:adenylosuccinate lyase [Bdellovibrionales bacterium]
MIDRYTRQEMGEIWSLENKFQTMLEVEIAVAQSQAQMKIIPEDAAKDIHKKGRFQIQRILDIEKETKHDVIAFVSNVAENVGKNGRYIHFGLTSSDVIDTALSLQVKQAGKVLRAQLKLFEKSLIKQIEKHKTTLCTGRTHGMHAEPTSFGVKLAGFLSELRRNIKRYDAALEDMSIGKLSGAVGTYSTQSPQLEKKVCAKLHLTPETIATQVIPRDRHAQLIHSLAMIGAGLERLAVELRHLQRTELQEVSEGFSKGQKGSSAMPHKKNPISSENITGASRLLRSYAQAAMEDIALWHERDISHSSVERVIFPDAFILCDYIVHRMSGVIDNLVVDKQRMLEVMNISKGQLFSSHVLLALVQKGLSREDAYKMVQRVSHSLNKGESLQEKLMGDKEISKYLTAKELSKIFSGEKHKKSILKLIERVI